MIRLKRWYRARQFIKAYKIMRNEYEKHRDAGHNIEFEAVNSAYMFTKCHDCPNLFP